MLYHHHHHPSPARPFIIICLIIIINNISSSAWRPSSDSSDLRSEFSDEERSGAGWLSWEIEIRLALRLAFICLPSDWCWHPADIQTLRNSKSSVWRGRRLVWWGEVRWDKSYFWHLSSCLLQLCDGRLATASYGFISISQWLFFCIKDSIYRIYIRWRMTVTQALVWSLDVTS